MKSVQNSINKKLCTYFSSAFKRNQLDRVRVVLFENITGNFLLLIESDTLSLNNEWAFLVLEVIQNPTEMKREYNNKEGRVK